MCFLFREKIGFHIYSNKFRQICRYFVGNEYARKIQLTLNQTAANLKRNSFRWIIDGFTTGHILNSIDAYITLVAVWNDNKWTFSASFWRSFIKWLKIHRKRFDLLYWCTHNLLMFWFDNKWMFRTKVVGNSSELI